MGTLRKLRRKSQDERYTVEPLRPQPASRLRKMSQVIQDFAEPLLDTIDDDESFENAIRFAAICWNLPFLPENEQKKLVVSMVNEVGKSDILKRLRVEHDIRMLLERKKAFFAHDRRMLMDFKVIEEKGSRTLLTMSALTKDRAEQIQRDAHKID